MKNKNEEIKVEEINTSTNKNESSSIDDKAPLKYIFTQ